MIFRNEVEQSQEILESTKVNVMAWKWRLKAQKLKGILVFNVSMDDESICMS